MRYEKALARFKSFGIFCDDRSDACDQNCDECELTESAIIEALEKQSEMVHCKDCKNWKIVTIETIYGKTVKIGQCELTKWLCGEQGYCMYGREVE